MRFQDRRPWCTRGIDRFPRSPRNVQLIIWRYLRRMTSDRNGIFGRRQGLLNGTFPDRLQTLNFFFFLTANLFFVLTQILSVVFLTEKPAQLGDVEISHLRIIGFQRNLNNRRITIELAPMLMVFYFFFIIFTACNYFLIHLNSVSE